MAAGAKLFACHTNTAAAAFMLHTNL